MASPEDVRKLASLARIRVGDSDVEKLAKEFDSILAYIGQIESLAMPIDLRDVTPPVRNVFRKDTHAYPPGTYTKAVTEQFPEREGDALKVKQILSYD